MRDSVLTYDSKGRWKWQSLKCQKCDVAFDEETFTIQNSPVETSDGYELHFDITVCKECYRQYKLNQIGI